MISEALRYLLTPCRRQYRRFGFLQEAIAIDARYRRCRAAWDEHLQASKEEIREAVRRCGEGGKVVVLGAGAGHDLPLDTLLAHFREVVLVDVIFLWPLRIRTLRDKRLRLIEADLTGLMEKLAAHRPKPGQAPPLNNLRNDLFDEADLVISVNLLSQLPLGPCRYLEKLGWPDDSPPLTALCRKIVETHLSWLRSAPCPVLLITDLERRVRRQGEVSVRENALYGVSMPEAKRQWIWRIAPKPEVDTSADVEHLVGAFYFPEEGKMGRKRQKR